MYQLTTTEQFSRQLVRFLRKHPDLTGQVGRVMDSLERDPYAPRLRLHALRGKHSGEHAVSVTYKYRVTLRIVVSDREIILLAIGTHDEVY